MDEEEAKKTLSEFMEAHKTNRSAYDTLSSELDDVEAEYKEKLEQKEEKLAEFKHDRAEVASEYVNIPADLIASRFSLDEVEQIIEEGAEFSESEETEEADEEDEALTSFADREERGREEGSGRTTQYRDRAEARLSEHGIPVGDN